MDSRSLHIIIAGGKTGGHLFPGIAVAQAARRCLSEAVILFVGTDHDFEITTLQRYGFPHKSIISAPIKGKNLLKKVWSLCIIGVSVLQAALIIRRFRPHVVLGVGGFSSFAVVFCAWLFRIPRAIQEQNSVPGITNRVLARFADRIFTAFKSTKGFDNPDKVLYTGNPVRRMPAAAAGSAKIRTAENRPEGLTILVTGGSQGAHSINKAVIDALNLIPDTTGLTVIHQTGTADAAWVKDRYQSLGITAETRAFFHDMPQRQDRADLVICRAGAGTLSELALKGLPAILIPFPYAADDHQASNARAVADAGAAVMLTEQTLTPGILAEQISRLTGDTEKLARMAAASRKLAMADADETIARELFRLARKRS